MEGIQTIGEKFKDTRIKKNLSIEYISNTLKIRKVFLEAIEKNNFSYFDSHVYAKGFIKNYANYLGLDSKSLLAKYRRDYENIQNNRFKKKELNEINNKVLPKKLSNYKITSRQLGIIFSIILGITILIILFNFINQALQKPYVKLKSPIELNANSSQTIDVYENSISLEGETSASTLIKINNVPISLESGYQFKSPSYPLTSQKTVFEITATNLIGINSKIELTINKKSVLNPTVFNGISGVVIVENENSIISIKSDNKTTFEGEVHSGDEFPVKANIKLNINSSKPQDIKLVVNNTIYRLKKINEEFDLINGKITQL